MNGTELKINYRSILRNHIVTKQEKNPQLSLRSIAKSLSISPSTLSEVLSGKKNLSVSKALAIAKKLKFSERDLQVFVKQVELEQATNLDHKQYILNQLNEENAPVYDLSVDQFHHIAKWYHLPILQMLRNDSKNISAVSIARRLGISTLEATEALDRLERLDLIEKVKTGFKVITPDVMVKSEIPSTALRMYHEQMLKKAIEALESQTPKEKWIGSENLAFDPNDLEKVDRVLNKAFDEIAAIAKKGKNKTEIYHLTATMFRLTKENIK